MEIIILVARHRQDMPKDQFDLTATNGLAVYLSSVFREPVMSAQQIFH